MIFISSMICMLLCDSFPNMSATRPRIGSDCRMQTHGTISRRQVASQMSTARPKSLFSQKTKRGFRALFTVAVTASRHQVAGIVGTTLGKRFQMFQIPSCFAVFRSTQIAVTVETTSMRPAMNHGCDLGRMPSSLSASVASQANGHASQRTTTPCVTGT